MNESDIEAYFRRIGYNGSREPSLATLRGLHRAHVLSVPFENLDIHVRREIALDQTQFYQKIVHGRRGGFCYEMNGLFGTLLRALGFDVTFLSGRFKRPDGWTPEFGHLTLMVQLDERWLADVGYGESFLEPLRLDEPGEQVQGWRKYRIVQQGEQRLLWQCNDGENWIEKYIFSLEPHTLEEYAGMSTFHQTAPESLFRQGRLCTIGTPEGRITLSERRIIFLRGQTRVEQPVNADEYAALLRQHFGIDWAEIERGSPLAQERRS